MGSSIFQHLWTQASFCRENGGHEGTSEKSAGRTNWKCRTWVHQMLFPLLWRPSWNYREDELHGSCRPERHGHGFDKEVQRYVKKAGGQLGKTTDEEVWGNHDWRALVESKAGLRAEISAIHAAKHHGFLHFSPRESKGWMCKSLNTSFCEV